MYDYDFIIKKLLKEFEGRVNFLGEDAEKYITLFQFQYRKKLQELVQMEKKVQKQYLID